MDLYILDPDINQLGIIDGYSSLRWRRRFFISIHTPREGSDYLTYMSFC